LLLSFIALAGFVFKSSQDFYLPERAQHFEELLGAVSANKTRIFKSGVLVSGPNGVGKSGLGALCFKSCFALGHFVVYVSDAREWVTAARAGRGDEFLLERFFKQNADKIAATPALRSVFSARLRGAPVQAAMMAELREVLTCRPGPVIAVIVDEVQNITDVIAKASQTQNPIASLQAAAAYFHDGWSNWNNANRCFVRMDIASSHGTREFNLPSGDENRLRFVHPWPLEVARAALSEKQSPVFLRQPYVRERVLYVAGGVIRYLTRCKELLPVGGVITHGELAAVEGTLRADMSRGCERWLKELSDDDQTYIANHLEQLLSGKLSWEIVKGAYDYGLVSRDQRGGVCAAPVSPVAASVIHRVLSRVLVANPHQPASSMNPTQRGYELERRVRAYLGSRPFNANITTLSLDTIEKSELHVQVDHVVPFGQFDNTAVPSVSSVYYTPKLLVSACDAIITPPLSPEQARQAIPDGADQRIVPESSSDAPPLQVWECSIQDPRTDARCEKLLGWFNPGGLIDQLRQYHPGRKIVGVLVWPEVMRKSKHSNANYKNLIEKARESGVPLMVVDNTVLSGWGISLSKPPAEHE